MHALHSHVNESQNDDLSVIKLHNNHSCSDVPFSVCTKSTNTDVVLNSWQTPHVTNNRRNMHFFTCIACNEINTIYRANCIKLWIAKLIFISNSVISVRYKISIWHKKDNKSGSTTIYFQVPAEHANICVFTFCESRHTLAIQLSQEALKSAISCGHGPGLFPSIVSRIMWNVYEVVQK